MAYRIAVHSNEDEVRLEPASGHQRWAAVLLLLGVVLLVAGLGAGRALGSPRAVIIGAAAAIWACAAAIGAVWLRRPRALVFDNPARCLRVGRERGALGVVPYDEIHGFKLRKAVVDEGSVAYEVSLQRSDGGLWQLFASGNQAAARAFHDELDNKVKLRAPGAVASRNADKSLASFGKLEVHRSDEATVISWSKRRLLWSHLLLLSSLFGPLVLFCGALVPLVHMRVALLSLLAVLLLLLLLAAAATLGLRQHLTISSERFEARTEGGLSLLRPFAMDNQDIHALVFHFAERRTRCIYFLPGDQSWSRQTVSFGEPSLRDNDDVPRVSVGELSLAEVVHLEGVIEAAIWHHTGHEVR